MSTFVQIINAHLVLLFLTGSFLKQVTRDRITAEKVTEKSSLCKWLPLLQLHCVGFMVHNNCVTLHNCWQLQSEQQAMLTITKSLTTFKLIHIAIPKPRKIKPLSTGAVKSTTSLFTATLGRDYKCLKKSWETPASYIHFILLLSNPT